MIYYQIGLVLMTILLVTSCYGIWNVIRKLELLENWIEDFINTIEKVQIDLQKIDYKGYFEADDEVGEIFKQIKTTINQLDRFKGKTFVLTGTMPSLTRNQAEELIERSGGKVSKSISKITSAIFYKMLII